MHRLLPSLAGLSFHISHFTLHISTSPTVETTDFEHADWRLLDGAEIYDRFVQKEAKLGRQGNKVIREMKRKG